VPADTPTNLYRLLVTLDNGNPLQRVSLEGVARVIQPGAATSLTLYIPRHRMVFRQGEAIEINAILRSRAALPAGTLRVSLAMRAGEGLAYQPAAPVWKTFPVQAHTHTQGIVTANRDQVIDAHIIQVF
jgi:hypothetical protein